MADSDDQLARAMLTARRGLTLAELTIALVLSGLVLGVVVGLALRQQRLYAALGYRLAAREQLRHTVAMLPVDLRAVTPAAGDIPGSGARDTSLELRATIASGVVCDASGSSIALAPEDLNRDLASFLQIPQAGDTLWLLGDAATVDTWDALAVAGVSTSVQRCPAGLGGRATTGGHAAVVVDTGDSAVARYPPGTPVRFTRRVRYDVYRAADGLWYLGFRDWNAVTARFNAVQPVSGPFERPVAGRPVFRYFDRHGAELPSGAADMSALALVEITMRSAGSALLGNAPMVPAVESAAVAVAVRNRW